MTIFEFESKTNFSGEILICVWKVQEESSRFRQETLRSGQPSSPQL